FFIHPSPTDCYTFPYTTLFRSLLRCAPARAHRVAASRQTARSCVASCMLVQTWVRLRAHLWRRLDCDLVRAVHPAADGRPRQARSEEHTSELQSQSNLVCRLLL